MVEDKVNSYGEVAIKKLDGLIERVGTMDFVNHPLVNHPHHYTSSGMECIDEMIILYGKEETMSFCKLNCHKYRKRAMDKGGRMDMDKSDWYANKYLELLATPELELIKAIKVKYELTIE